MKGEINENVGIYASYIDYVGKELSSEYGLYRQDYCGCEFSKTARERQIKKGD